MTDFSEPYTDGKQNEQVKALLEQEKLYTEQEAMQEEISYRMPASIKILLKYEWKPLIRILACVGLAVAMYFIFGWDAVAMAIAIFIFTAFMAYLIKSKDMSRNATYIVETKLAGQKITTGDHSPYSKSFYVTESAFRIWEVPNVLIENKIFRMPSDQAASALPGTGRYIFVDFFDRMNRTCVLPRDMDVSNFSLATNANPMLSEKLNLVAEEVMRIKEMERTAFDLYSTGHLSAEHAADLLRPVARSKKVLLDPMREKKRNVHFELQASIPTLREEIQDLSNRTFLYANFLGAKIAYQLVNIPMPKEIEKNHDIVNKLMGNPNLLHVPANKSVDDTEKQ